MRNPKISKEAASHYLAKVCGVTEDDTVFGAAEKAIQTMRAAGMSPRTIRKAEKMVADAKARAAR